MLRWLLLMLYFESVYLVAALISFNPGKIFVSFIINRDVHVTRTRHFLASL